MVSISTSPIEAPKPGENPFEMNSPINGYVISLTGNDLREKLCVKIGKNLVGLDYLFDFSIGNKSIAGSFDGMEDSKELNEKIIEACKDISKSTNKNIAGTYIFAQ